MKKFGAELKAHCKVKKLNHIFNKYKRVNGKTTMVWTGIKKVIEEENDDDGNDDKEKNMIKLIVVIPF